MLTSNQLRAARALLRVEQIELAEHAGVSAETVRRFEASDGLVRGREDTLRAVKTTLERLGAIFIDEDNDAGIGVRLAQDTKALRWNETVERVFEALRTSIDAEIEARDLRSAAIKEALDDAFYSAGKELFMPTRDSRIPDMFAAEEDK